MLWIFSQVMSVKGSSTRNSFGPLRDCLWVLKQRGNSSDHGAIHSTGGVQVQGHSQTLCGRSQSMAKLQLQCCSAVLLQGDSRCISTLCVSMLSVMRLGSWLLGNPRGWAQIMHVGSICHRICLRSAVSANVFQMHLLPDALQNLAWQSVDGDTHGALGPSLGARWVRAAALFYPQAPGSLQDTSSGAGAGYWRAVGWGSSMGFM